MSEINSKILYQLHEQVLNLLDDLLNICPNESEILIMRIYVENNIKPEKLMKKFNKYVYPWKDHILERNEDYFLKNKSMFGTFSNKRVNCFFRMYKDDVFDQDDKEIIWKYFEVFINLIERYNKIK